ncbi:MAG: stress response translation initiation inhibitor YciH [Candidatus Odinarchaeota archaeon]|nr:stress response translation initiation inhibitor YciH [Candidatus Odinarchaeota archaeon]
MDKIVSIISKKESEIKVYLERRKFGKPVTVITGFDEDTDIKKIASDLKNALACGGTAKKGRIELQGDHRRTIRPVLERLGFKRIIII